MDCPTPGKLRFGTAQSEGERKEEFWELDLASGKRRSLLEGVKLSHSAKKAISRDGKLLLEHGVGDGEGYRLTDLATGRELLSELPPATGPRDFRLTDDPTRVLVVDTVGRDDLKVSVWNLARKKFETAPVELKKTYGARSQFPPQLLPGGRWVLSASVVNDSWPSELVATELGTGRRVRLPAPRIEGFIKISADGRRLAIASGLDSVLIYDLPSLAPFRRIVLPIGSARGVPALSPDGRYFLITSEVGVPGTTQTLRVWDTRTGTKVHENWLMDMPRPAGRIRETCFVGPDRVAFVYADVSGSPRHTMHVLSLDRTRGAAAAMESELDGLVASLGDPTEGADAVRALAKSPAAIPKLVALLRKPDSRSPFSAGPYLARIPQLGSNAYREREAASKSLLEAARRLPLEPEQAEEVRKFLNALAMPQDDPEVRQRLVPIRLEVDRRLRAELPMEREALQRDRAKEALERMDTPAAQKALAEFQRE